MEIRFYVPQGDVDGDAVEVIINQINKILFYYSIGFPSKCYEKCSCINS
jgi:hypothetical protein